MADEAYWMSAMIGVDNENYWYASNFWALGIEWSFPPSILKYSGWSAQFKIYFMPPQPSYDVKPGSEHKPARGVTPRN